MKSYRFIYISLLLLATVFCYGQDTEPEPEEESITLLEEAVVAVEEETIAEAEYEVDESNLSPMTRSEYLNADTDYKDRYTGSEYTYVEKKEKPEKRSDPKELKKPSAPMMSGDFIGIILKVLLGIVVLIGILFLVQALRDVGISKVGFKKKEKEVKRTVSAEVKDLEAPTELDETNLQLMLKNALAENDLYSAVRYYFLIYLEKLERNGKIVYHQDKTNADYLAELGKSPSSETFAQLSYLYEYLWYGKKELTAPVFQQVSDTFKKAISK